MLLDWLKQTNPLPTWTAIVTALKKPAVRLEQLAEEIEKKWISESNGIAAEVAKLSFPHIKDVAPDDRMREELEQRLRVESKDIIQEFRILRNKFFDSLEERKITVGKLVEYLEEEIDDHLQQQVINSFEDVKNFIKRISSFYDYQLIKYMIRLTGTEKDKDQLEEYEKAFLYYAKRRIYECPSTFGNLDDAGSELHVKLDSKYDGCNLEQLKEFQYRLCSILRISVYVCRLKSIEKGCLFLTFMIPHHVQETTFPLSAEQETVLIELKVLQIVCGDYQQHFNKQGSHSVL